MMTVSRIVKVVGVSNRWVVGVVRVKKRLT